MKADNPKFSIIIITLNSGDTLAGCLSSIFSVKYPRNMYEVIIVDAGSSDGTLEIAKKFPVDKVIVEQGALRGRARNIGLKEAKGEIVAMVDSDLTSLDDDWILKAEKALKDPNVAVVRGNDLIPIPTNDMSFRQRALFFMSIAPTRILREE
ncbi:MAG: glycosyltransferase [Candidatus Bathyarchaeota archaeon]|nr:MAG: glycosyltransferase [Candidatus Bathyarchaeota archaeon]